MAEVAMYRVRNLIYNADGSLHGGFRSINAAKRESRQIQKGGVVLRTADKAPKPQAQ